MILFANYVPDSGQMKFELKVINYYTSLALMIS